MIRRLLPAFVALSCFAPPAFAWGALGHRLVAALAQDELTSKAEQEVDRLLRDEAVPPQPGSAKGATVPPLPDRDKAKTAPTLADIATWADELRAKDPGLGKRSAGWHYVNLAEHDCSYEPVRDCKDGNCVVEAIRAQTAILADRGQSREARTRALKFVVHFIGDVHQPMHAGYARDKGGNDFQLSIQTADGTRRGTNLHSLWDSGMLRDAKLDEAAWLQRLRALPLAVEASPSPLPPHAAEWAQQSCRIAVSPGVYPPSAKLPATYEATWLPVAEAQLRRGGSHLAAVLNAALGD